MGTNHRLAAMVLAAGHGKRMRSSLPKPLHPLCGQPMLVWVLDSLEETAIESVVVVVGHGAEQVTKRVSERPSDQLTSFVEQRVQRGTGDAVSVGLAGLSADFDDSTVLVLPGDTPLLQPTTIAALLRHHLDTGAACTLVTAELEDPTGYGRIVRDEHGGVVRIVEHKDAMPGELAIGEINAGVYCFRRTLLAAALRRVTPNNAQGEYYLPDVVEVLCETGHRLEPFVVTDAAEIQGVNDRAQLAAAEDVLRRRINGAWMRAGVTMLDPDNTYVDASVDIAPDVTLLPGTILAGRTVVGEGATIGPSTHLVDCAIGSGAVVANTVGRDAEVEPGASVGPFAVLEPGDHIAAGAAPPHL